METPASVGPPSDPASVERPPPESHSTGIVDPLLAWLSPLRLGLLLLLPTLVISARAPRVLQDAGAAAARLREIAALVLPAALAGRAQDAIDAIDGRVVLNLAVVAGLIAFQRFRIIRFENRLARSEDARARLDQRLSERDRGLVDLEAQRVELQAKYHDLVEESHDLVFRHDLAGRFLSITKRGAEFLGYPIEELTSLTLSDVCDAASLPEVTARIGRLASGLPVGRLQEVMVYTREGKPLWLELQQHAVVHNGVVIAIDGVARDVSPRQTAAARTSLLSAIGQAAAEAVSLEAALRAVLRTLCNRLRWDYGEIWSVDEQYDVLRVKEIWHTDRPDLERLGHSARKKTIARGWGLPGRVWASANAIRIPRLMDAVDEWSEEIARTTRFQSALGFPIRVASRVLGVVVLLCEQERYRGEPAPDLIDGLAGQLGEIVDRARAEEALKTSEARMHAILESALDCIITADHEGRILEFNPAAERTFGHARADVLGKDLVELIVPPEARASHLAAFRASVSSGLRQLRGRRIEVIAQRADGEQFPAELSVTRIEVGDAPVYTAYLRNIIERKEVDRLKDELVSTVSHELRTPLASLRGFVELMLTREYSPAERRRFLSILDVEIQRLTKLIDQFLDLQRLEAGAHRYELERADLNALVRSTLDVFAAQQRSHSFRAELSERPVWVRMDLDRMRQVLLNLISNAVKYSPDGGTVTVRCQMDRQIALVEVMDEGVGMDAETVRRLFRKFYRADGTVTRTVGGTGLGLALVKEIVTAHGGSVRVKSTVGRGSVFLIEVPGTPSEGEEPGYEANE